MPNWVYNTLTIEGNPISVKRLKKQVNQKYTKIHDQWNMKTMEMEQVTYTYSKPVFSFHNIFNHTQDGVPDEVYNSQPNHKSGDTLAEMFKGSDWYSWNVRNWGTKWDVAVSNDGEYPDTELLDEGKNGENYVLVYKYNTAWSPAVPIIEKLSAQYPDLLFTLSYEEEQGWGGEMEFLKGKITAESSYDWKCRECDVELDESPWCDDCEFDTCPSCGYNEADENCKKHREEINV